ncbi:hypothetical protein V2A60_005635 [Cordyceps javanica]
MSRFQERRFTASRATYKRGQRSLTPHARSRSATNKYFGAQRPRAIYRISTTTKPYAIHLCTRDGTPPARNASLCRTADSISSGFSERALAMSLPPNVIRVKRKRVEESPVTFLQIDGGAKRHRSDSSHWVYQRRGSTAQRQSRPSPLGAADAKPQTQLSTVPGGAEDDDDAAAAAAAAARRDEVAQRAQDAGKPTPAAPSEPRRFRVSKTMLAALAADGGLAGPASKRDRHGTPTLFVERSRRKKLAPKPRRSMLALGAEAAGTGEKTDVEVKNLKRPGVTQRAREVAAQAEKEPAGGEAAPKPRAATAGGAANPLPPSLTNRATEDMSKITADMNEWVMREMGANLKSLEEERRKESKPKPPPASPSRFKPRPPAKRYHERHPEVSTPGAAVTTTTDPEGDTNMTDASEEEDDGDGDDWIIEEYVRVPANSVALDVSPSDVGFLVLDGEEESLLFFGPQNDEDEDWDEDEEDENAENHYTADYPEDEVDSEDEFNRNAYYFRNANASDDEEYDQDEFGYDDDHDDDAFSADGRGGDDDDARMTRILEQMKRLKAAQR